MKNKTLLLIFALTAIFTGLAAQTTLRHDQPASYLPNAETMLLLEITEEIENVSEVNLYYRESGDFSYINLQMLRSEDEPSSFFANIPPMPDNKKGIEYYFEVLLKSGVVMVEPVGNPASVNPYRLFLELPAVAPSSAFVLLSPLEPNVLPDEDLIIAISMFKLENAIAPGSITIKFDGKDRTGKAAISSNMLVLNLGKPRPGNHTFAIEATHKNNGKQLYRSWNVAVAPEQRFELPMNMQGRLSVTTKLESQSSDNEGLEDDDKYANYNLNLSGKKSWFSFNTNLMLTSRESSKRQSQNRYTLTLKVPHFDFVIGDYAPRYDSFTMRGRNIRGYHPKLHFKNFSLAVSFGQSKRALDGEISSATNETVRYGTFQRNSLGIRMEMGNIKTLQNSFLWGVSVAKSKDELNSLDKEYFLQIVENTEEESDDTVHVVTPKDNLVIGSDITLSLYKKRLIWGAEFAFSMYNNDITNGVSTIEELEDMGINKDDLEELPDFEDFEDIIVINKNLEPFKPNKASMALKYFVNLNVYHNYLTFNYSEVGASFNSLSSSTGQKDAQILNITDYLHLMQNKILLSFGHTHTTDNLSNHRSYDYKSDSYFFNANLRFPNMPTLSMGYSTNNNFDDAADSLSTTDTKTNRFNTTVGYEVKQITFAPTKFSVTFSTSSNIDDLNSAWDNSSNTIGFTAYSKYRDLPMSSTIRFTTTGADNKSNDIDYSSDYNALLLKVNYNFMDNKINPYISYQMVSNTGEDASGADIDKSINTFATGASFNVLKNTDLSTSIMFKGYADGNQSDNDYSLFDWGMKASYRF